MASSKKREYVSAIDHGAAEGILTVALLLDNPDQLTKRQSFAKCLPKIHALRNRGYTFPQITKLLNQAGIKLQLSTVKNYFVDLTAKSDKKLLQEWIEKEMQIIDEIRSRNDASASMATWEEMAARHYDRIVTLADRQAEQNLELDSKGFQVDGAPDIAGPSERPPIKKD